MAKFDEENPDDFMKWIAAFRHKYKGLHNAPNGNPHGDNGVSNVLEYESFTFIGKVA